MVIHMPQSGGVIGHRKKATVYTKSKTTLCRRKRSDPLDLMQRNFETFVRHADADYFSRGSYGLVYKLTLRDPSDSPYIDLAGRPVDTLIVKVGFIREDGAAGRWSIRSDLPEPQSLKDFKSESNTQDDIFLASLTEYASAICPAIIYKNVLASDRFQAVFPDLFSLLPSSPPSTRYSLIGMETYRDVLAASDLNRDNPELKAVCFSLLVRMGALGLAHGDPSWANFILDTGTSPYRPYIIDFGTAIELSEEETTFLQTQLGKITDFEKTMKIIAKGNPTKYGNDPTYGKNFSWLTGLSSIPGATQKTLATFEDSGWEKVLRTNSNP